MRITTDQSEISYFVSVALLCLLCACPSVKSYDRGNGDDSVLHVDLPDETCQDRIEGRNGSCNNKSCWMLRLEMQPLQMRVRQRWSVADCNGIGDCSTTIDWGSVADLGAAEITVKPPQAASVELLPDCGGDLMFALTPHAAEAFEVQIEVGDLKDSFQLQTVDSCPIDEEICRGDLIPRCCCEPRYTTCACG